MNIIKCSTPEEFKNKVTELKSTGLKDVTPLVAYAQTINFKPLNQMLDDFYSAQPTQIVDLDADDYEYDVAFLSDMECTEVKRIMNFRVPNKIISKLSGEFA